MLYRIMKNYKVASGKHPVKILGDFNAHNIVWNFKYQPVKNFSLQNDIKRYNHYRVSNGYQRFCS